MSPTSAAKALIALSILFVSALDVSLYFSALAELAPLVLAMIVPALAAGCVFGWFIVRSGPGRLPTWAVGLAVLHCFGGALFDMIATILHTPDLSLEANPIARNLLDTGVPVAVVYGYAIVAQAGLQLLSVLGVCGWLRWRGVFADGTLRVDRETLALRLLIAWVPCDMLWSLLRWYLGFEWFSQGILPQIRDQHVLPIAIPLGILADGLLARRLAGLSGP